MQAILFNNHSSVSMSALARRQNCGAVCHVDHKTIFISPK